MKKPLIIGLGNQYRGDDAVGLEVAGLLKKEFNEQADIMEYQGNPLDLLEIWTGKDCVFIIDAVSSDEQEVGFVYRFLPHKEEIPAVFSRASTHLIDVIQVIELGKTLGNCPKDLVVYGIEASQFALEQSISQKLKNKVPDIFKTIEKHIREKLCMK